LNKDNLGERFAEVATGTKRLSPEELLFE